MINRSLLTLCHWVLGLCLFSCSAPNLYESNRQLLQQASDYLEQGQFQQATQKTDALVFATAETGREYALQRFFAAYLGAQAHLAASYGDAFLRDPESKQSLGIDQQARGEGSQMAHMVAFGRSAGYGLDWLPQSASEASLREQLPGTLARLGLSDARDNLKLALLTNYTRLGFHNKTAAGLDNFPGLLDLAGCQSMLERSGFLPDARPWVMYMVFRHIKETNEPVAFRFAAEALFNRLPAEIELEMKNWIMTESSLRFTCPEGQHPADPSRELCHDDVPLRDFICGRKS